MVAVKLLKVADEPSIGDPDGGTYEQRVLAAMEFVLVLLVDWHEIGRAHV